jgi:hypothetical protein
MEQELTIDVEPWEPDDATIGATLRAVGEHPAIRELLQSPFPARYALSPNIR